MYIKSSDIQGIVFAGGRGKRLVPLTNILPKPLIKYNNKELILYSIEALKKAQINDINIIVSYKKQYILDFLGGDYRYIDSDIENNIFYLILNEANRITKDYLLFIDGDSVLNLDIINESIKNIKNDADGVIVVSENSKEKSYWEFEIDNSGFIHNIKRSVYGSSPRIFILINRKKLMKVYKFIEKNFSIEKYKFENCFLKNYEEFYLGWGLVLKLLIDQGTKLHYLSSQSFYANINKINK